MSSRRKRILEAAAAERKNKPLVPAEDLSRVFDRFFTGDSPVPDEGPVVDKGPVRRSGPVKSIPVALQNDGPSLDAGPAPYTGPTPEYSLLNSLPDVDGFIFWFHQLTDYLCRQITPPEQAVYLQLYRLSYGFGSSRCIVGFPKLAERSCMSESGARLAANGLIKKGLVRKLGMVFGKNKEQGIEWEVFEPPALVKFRASRGKGPALEKGPAPNEGPPRRTPIKEYKDKDSTQTQAVGVSGSKYSLEQCQKYAASLVGKGINNPMGYATTIYRSGEADSLIEVFFHPAPTVDVSKCPDCAGTGFIYPDGVGKGPVKKCKHPRLV